jgi:SAM-dependent methyltransferase
MLALARARAARRGAAARVRFECADARTWRPDPGSFDAIVTMFFFDCFTAADVGRIARTLAGGLRPGGQWIYADFAVPARGLARLHARAWTALLYAFFRWETGLDARQIPPSETIIESLGFAAVEQHTFRAGLVRAVAFARRAA